MQGPRLWANVTPKSKESRHSNCSVFWCLYFMHSMIAHMFEHVTRQYSFFHFLWTYVTSFPSANSQHHLMASTSPTPPPCHHVWDCSQQQQDDGCDVSILWCQHHCHRLSTFWLRSTVASLSAPPSFKPLTDPVRLHVGKLRQSGNLPNVIQTKDVRLSSTDFYQKSYTGHLCSQMHLHVCKYLHNSLWLWLLGLEDC